MTALAIADGSLFGADNLPYGVFSTAGTPPRVGVRVGDAVVDLAAALGTDGPDAAFAAPALNPFMAQGRARWTEVRERITALVTGDVPDAAVHAVDDVVLHLPFEVADYVDFYASEHHATNLGRLFRPDSEPLTPNWKHMPVGYHGRAGTVVVSGHRHRPPVRAAQGPRRCRADVRPEHPARHRGRAGLRRRCRHPARRTDPRRRLRRARLRRRAGQRLVRPRPAGVGVRAAGTAPGQELRHVRVALGGPAARAGGRADPPARPERPAAAALPARERPMGTRRRPRRRVERRGGQPPAVPARCTGRPHRCWRT